MTFEVRTKVFEGPLDLLLQLITSHQLEITELSLVGIVNEYLTFLEEVRELDLEVTSEFLLIAATLIQMKARRLLPDDIPVDLDEELALAEERDRLLSRLLACLTFKDVAAVLAHRMDAANRRHGRFVGIPADISPRLPEVVLPVDAAGLAHVAELAFSTPMAEPTLDHLDLNLPSVQDAIVDLQGRMAASIVADFDDVVSGFDRDVEVVAYFLALLELARWGIVRVSQQGMFDEIRIEYDADAADANFEELVAGGADS